MNVEQAFDQMVVISPKYGKQTILIDKEDYNLIDGSKLFLSRSGQFLYVRVSPSKKYLHRLVTHAPKGKVVDHKNRNTLDNRKRNQKRPNNKTGVTGVAIYSNGYTAQIKHNYKKIHLGVFKTIKEATKARKAAEARLWGVQ